jgi:RHS repeat-associated protein
VAQIEATGQIHYLHPDHLMAPRQATDAYRAVVWRWEGEPFGDASPAENPDVDAWLVEVNLRFPGQYFDAETHLVNNWHREYSALDGRYIESDPIGLEGGLSTFAYAESSPLLFSDPLGLEKINPFGPSEDRVYHDTVERSFDDGVFCQVYAHGNRRTVVGPDGISWSPRGLADELERRGCRRGQTVILYACSTGDGADSYAERFSREWRGFVVAPDKQVWARGANQSRSARGPTEVFGKKPPVRPGEPARMDRSNPGSFRGFLGE